MTSDREATIVDAVSGPTVVGVVPNGVDPDFFVPTGVGASARHAGLQRAPFIPTPNLDAASYFVEQILPRLLRARPSVHVTIVGEGRPSELRSLRHPNVTLTGKVPDVRPYLQRAAVVVIPIRMGGGTRLKVLGGACDGQATSYYRRPSAVKACRSSMGST